MKLFSAPKKEEVKVVEEPKKLRPLKTLFEWQAPSRPFKKRSREYFTTAGSIALLLIIILVFFQEWLLIMVIIAVVFVSYVFASVQPENVSHKITTRGIITGDKDYRFDKLSAFWFGQRWGQEMLFVDTKISFPRRLIILLADVSKEEIKKALSEFIDFEEPEKTWLDKAGEWLSARVPLE